MSDFSDESNSEENSTNSNIFTVFPYELEFVECSQDYFSVLPSEILLNIFKCLSFFNLRLCASVCKRFYSLSFHSTLWGKVSLSKRKLRARSLERILNCRVKTFELEYSGIIDVHHLDYPFFQSQEFSHLQSLSIVYTAMNSRLLEELLSLAPNLKVLTLECVCKVFNYEALAQLKYLEELNLSEYCLNSNVDFLNTAKFIHLRKMKLYSVIGNDELLCLCPNIEVLYLEHFLLDYSVLQDIFKTKNLRVLSLDYAEVNTMQRMLPLLESCEDLSELHYLRLSKIYFYDHHFTTNLYNTFFRKFLLRCRNVIELELTEVQINHEVLVEILKMNRLRKLSISDIDKFVLPDNFVSRRIANNETLRNLEDLNISFKHHNKFPEEIETILVLCCYLKSIRLENIHPTDKICQRFASFSDLQTLYVFNEISDIPFYNTRMILKGCPNLTRHNCRLS